VGCIRQRLLGPIRTLETVTPIGYLAPNIRIVFVGASGTRPPEYCLKDGRLVAVASAPSPEIATDAFGNTEIIPILTVNDRNVDRQRRSRKESC
jgi:hypothetical protein